MWIEDIVSRLICRIRTWVEEVAHMRALGQANHRRDAADVAIVLSRSKIA